MNNGNSNRRLLRLKTAAALLAVAGLLLFSAAFLLFKSNENAASVPQNPDSDNSVIYECPPHEWENGECRRCRLVCSHESHDPETQCCTVCGEKVCHEYIKLHCRCGKDFSFEDSSFEQSLLSACERKGTVETVEYNTKNYYSGNLSPTAKKMDVYLPYAYTPDEKYDVVFLLPGSRGRYSYWFEDVHYYKYPDGNVLDVYTGTLFDNMIDRKLCRPFITVSLSYYLGEEEIESGDLYSRDALQSRYSIYGTREHFAFIGASAGSIVGIRAVLMDSLDRFGWFGFISGCSSTNKEIIASLKQERYSGLPIYYLYSSAGSEDGQRQSTTELYNCLINAGIVDSNNSCFIDIRNSGHEDRVWFTGLYNCMQIFFNHSDQSAG